MAGNILEWCLDEYDANFYGVSQGENPLSGANTPQEISENFYAVKSIRVLRGGSWIVNSAGVRNSTRFTLTPESVHETVGFPMCHRFRRCRIGRTVYWRAPVKKTGSNFLIDK